MEYGAYGDVMMLAKFRKEVIANQHIVGRLSNLKTLKKKGGNPP